MRHFLQAAAYVLLDLAATLVFAIVFFATGNTVLAVGIGMALGLFQIATKLVRRKPVQPLEWLGLVIVVSAGTATLLTDDPRFLLFKPSIIYAAIGVVMLKPGWLLRYLPPLAQRVSPDVATAVGFAWAGLMFVSAAVNAGVAIALDVRTWALVMPAFGIASKVLVFVAGFAALKLVTHRRIRAMAPADREAVLAQAS